MDSSALCGDFGFGFICYFCLLLHTHTHYLSLFALLIIMGREKKGLIKMGFRRENENSHPKKRKLCVEVKFGKRDTS